MTQRQIPHVDEELVRLLKKKFPPIEYKQGDRIETFSNEAIFRAGQRDIINQLEIWYKHNTGG